MKLEVLIGMIASGKSTYARHRADEGALIVSHDDLTEMLHKRYRYEADLRKCYQRMMNNIAVAGMEEGRDVVIDRTNLTVQSRELWVRLGCVRREYGDDVTLVAVVFPVEGSPIQHGERRFLTDNRGRSQGEWHKVALHHHKQLLAEPVTLAEGFDEIVNVSAADVQAWAREPCPFPAYLPPRG